MNIHNDLHDNNKDINTTWSLNVLTVSAGFDQCRLVLIIIRPLIIFVTDYDGDYDTATGVVVDDNDNGGEDG